MSHLSFNFLCKQIHGFYFTGFTCKSFCHTLCHTFSCTSPVNASPWIPFESISGRLFAGKFEMLRFLIVSKPPKPWSKIPSWKPLAPLRFGPNIPIVFVYRGIFLYVQRLQKWICTHKTWNVYNWSDLPGEATSRWPPEGYDSTTEKHSPRKTMKSNAPTTDGEKMVVTTLWWLRRGGNPWSLTIVWYSLKHKSIHNKFKVRIASILCATWWINAVIHTCAL